MKFFGRKMLNLANNNNIKTASANVVQKPPMPVIFAASANVVVKKNDTKASILRANKGMENRHDKSKKAANIGIKSAISSSKLNKYISDDIKHLSEHKVYPFNENSSQFQSNSLPTFGKNSENSVENDALPSPLVANQTEVIIRNQYSAVL